MERCLTCEERPAHTRGCCGRCYRCHREAVAGGAATWAALEAAGKALPPQRRGQAWAKDFYRWMTAKRN